MASTDDSENTDLVVTDLASSEVLRRRRDRIARHFASLETRIQKVEAYREANLEQSIDMFKQRLEILDALAKNFKDEKGEFCPHRIRRCRDELRIYLGEMQNIEKQAGLIPTKKEQVSVTVTLSDKWKALRQEIDGEFDDAIDVEVVDE